MAGMINFTVKSYIKNYLVLPIVIKLSVIVALKIWYLKHSICFLYLRHWSSTEKPIDALFSFSEIQKETLRKVTNQVTGMYTPSNIVFPGKKGKGNKYKYIRDICLH